jgi:hypothetical protein
LDLKNKVESLAFVVKSHEEDLHEETKEIEMLKKELLEQEKVIFTLKMKGMYAFCVYL